MRPPLKIAVLCGYSDKRPYLGTRPVVPISQTDNSTNSYFQNFKLTIHTLYSVNFYPAKFGTLISCFEGVIWFLVTYTAYQYHANLENCAISFQSTVKNINASKQDNSRALFQHLLSHKLGRNRFGKCNWEKCILSGVYSCTSRNDFAFHQKEMKSKVDLLIM